MDNKRRNVGIFAYVDAGKTTTTEQMLYYSGQIKELGNVDSGTTRTDDLDVERARGISVQSALTLLQWRGVSINLIDTPGHVDFLAEVERSLRVMDGAIMIVSAVEGVQAQTEVIWQALRDLCIPTLIYVNKMDRIGADSIAVLAQIRQLLSQDAMPIQAPEGVEATFIGTANLLDDTVLTIAEWMEPYRTMLMEAAAERDDQLMEQFFERENLSAVEMDPVIVRSAHRSECFPVLFGASNLGIGIKELMDAVVRFLPPPLGSSDAPVSGVVFKLGKDPSLGKVAYVRLYEGAIQNRDIVHNHTLDLEEKVTQIRRTGGKKVEDIGVLNAGDIAAVYGWSQARIGDIIGSPDGVPGIKRLAVPLLAVQVHWQDQVDYPAVVGAFQELADEDPLLDLQWLQDDHELHLKVMGQIQIEILMYLLKNRFGLDVHFGAPTVIYKETPAKAGVGYIAYTMPKPCWAVLRFQIEPGERGSGLQYHSIVRHEHILARYQNEVARSVPEALRQGLKGWEVTDLRVTLIEGEDHIMHTHPLDFVVATPMGIMNGLLDTETKLLEPMLWFRLSIPEEYSGKMMNELVVMRGTFETPAIRDGRMTIEGTLPVVSSLDFPARLGSLTKGRGTLTVNFTGYQESPPDVDTVRPRKGVNPLDQSKYILAARKALI